ncbi:MAG: hypothetical protein ACK5QC_13090 [Bacteroidota bacterium]
MTTEGKAADNSTYKKLAGQWLNEALCFVSSSLLADKLFAPKSPTFCSCKTLAAISGHSTRQKIN